MWILAAFVVGIICTLIWGDDALDYIDTKIKQWLGK